MRVSAGQRQTFVECCWFRCDKTGFARPYCPLPGKVANFLDYVGRLSENRRVTAYRQFIVMTESPPQPEPSESRFTVVRLHAKGGLGQISLARDEKLKRRVALKEIRPDKRANPEIRRRFLTEAEITGQLEHPGIVPIYDLDEGNDGEVRYAMRFVEGRTLGDAVREYYQDPSPLAFRGLLQRFVNVCETIAYAHSQGVIHRDLKPANVLLGDYGETLVVDWGLAKRLADSPAKSTPVTIPSIATTSALDETTDYVETPADDNSLTLAGQVLGTPAYMAPEQANGDVAVIGVPADVYGLGAILYEILTGRHPSQGRTPKEAILAITQGKHERPSELRKGVPRALEAICLKAMAPQRRDRYGGALDLARDIECWLADEPVSAYQEPIWNRFARWRRRYRTPLIAITVLCTTALIVGGIGGALALRERERTRALGRVDAVREATPASVPFLLSTLDVSNKEVQYRLWQLWEDDSLTAGQRRRVGLALLAADPDRVRGRLLDVLLETEDPQEFLMVRDGLAPHMATHAEALWIQAQDPGTRRRFLLLVALAAFDPQSPRWSEFSSALTEDLLASNSLRLGSWSSGLAPVRAALVPSLRQSARENRGVDRGVISATILSEYAGDEPDILIEALLEANPRQFDVLWPAIPKTAGTAGAMQVELERKLPAEAPDDDKDGLAYRQANAAVALARLDREDLLWPLLRTTPEPRVRTYLIHRLSALGIEPTSLLNRFAAESDASARQALLLSLGEYGSDQLSVQERQTLLSVSTKALDDPAPGVHSAADWLTRRLGEVNSVPAAEGKPHLAAVTAKRDWYIGPEGHTLVIVRGPTEYPRSHFVKGRDGGSEKEVLQTASLPYSFAVATRKVTLSQFRRFLNEHPDREYPFIKPRGQDAEEPATQVTWVQAAKYCRWLSELEHVTDDQMCFPKIDEIKEGLELPADYSGRTGYRLPTSAEWECVCRAGSVTKLFFGSDEELLPHYGWHADNSGRLLRPVGLLKPNDLGLFDIYGLAYEWCSDRIFFSPGVEERIFRGSTRFLEPQSVATSSPGILANRPTYRGNECGMRIVRTLPSAK